MKIGFGAEDFLNRRYHRIVLCNLTGAAQTLAQWTAFVNDDAPFAIIFIGRRFVWVPIDAKQVFIASVAKTQVPPPIFLTGSVGVNTAVGQFFAEPRREVLAKAAGIDKVIANFG